VDSPIARQKRKASVHILFILLVADYWQTLSAVCFPNLPKYSCFDFVIRHFLAIITALGDVAQLGERGVRNELLTPI
jgi:hypothetical protein